MQTQWCKICQSYHVKQPRSECVAPKNRAKGFVPRSWKGSFGVSVLPGLSLGFIGGAITKEGSIAILVALIAIPILAFTFFRPKK